MGWCNSVVTIDLLERFRPLCCATERVLAAVGHALEVLGNAVACGSVVKPHCFLYPLRVDCFLLIRSCFLLQNASDYCLLTFLSTATRTREHSMKSMPSANAAVVPVGPLTGAGIVKRSAHQSATTDDQLGRRTQIRQAVRADVATGALVEKIQVVRWYHFVIS